jgi:hypothetical protein
MRKRSGFRKAGQITARGQSMRLVRIYRWRDPETGTRKYQNQTTHDCATAPPRPSISSPLLASPLIPVSHADSSVPRCTIAWHAVQSTRIFPPRSVVLGLANGMESVNPIQVFVDSSLQGRRGEEQAEFLIEHTLGFHQ